MTRKKRSTDLRRDLQHWITSQPRTGKREAWMADFERRIVAAVPVMAGRIDWNTAIHLFNTGWTPDTAAARVLKSSTVECAYPDCRKPIPNTYGKPGVATSRLDSKTLICSACGTREAFEPNVMNKLNTTGA